MESEERGAPGPLYLRALGFSTTRAQLPQKRFALRPLLALRVLHQPQPTSTLMNGFVFLGLMY